MMQPAPLSYDRIREFFRLEAAGGMVLGAAALLAIILDNSPLRGFYDALLNVPFTVAVGSLGISKPLLLWINDGLMAIFFLLVGMELKREVLEGELSSKDQIALPALAALAGMAMPALIYLAVTSGTPGAARGWAIPAATDIAFALGILSLLGSRVPVSVKVFLTAIAVMDDLGAIIIIAAFYTDDLGWVPLALAAVAALGLFVLNRRGVTARAPYVLVGLALWVFVLKSGVHATLAGVLVGLAIPLRAKDSEGHSPLRHLEHTLHPWVAFGVLPIFAFANAGLPLLDMRPADMASAVPLGIALGLIFGKQLGIFGATWLAVKCGLARLPTGMDWRAVYGVAVLAGVGFTMSLFIGSLAFDQAAMAMQTRLGIICGSLVCGALGYGVLRLRFRAGDGDEIHAGSGANSDETFTDQ
jgi:NhaA family Na+:H+ antiporter